jgi:hypothetical protein
MRRSNGFCAMCVESCTTLFYIVSPMLLGSEAWAAEVAARMAQGHPPHRSQSTFMAFCASATLPRAHRLRNGSPVLRRHECAS